MANRCLLLLWLVLLLSALILTPALLASGPTGTITGTVTDPTGAVVRNAKIVVINEATNAVREAETNDDGDFTLALLQPGRYRVTAESAGFRKSIFSDVVVDVDQTIRVDFSLVVGVATEEIKVKDTPPAIQTDTSTLGQVVNNTLVQQLPLNGATFSISRCWFPEANCPLKARRIPLRVARSA